MTRNVLTVILVFCGLTSFSQQLQSEIVAELEIGLIIQGNCGMSFSFLICFPFAQGIFLVLKIDQISSLVHNMVVVLNVRNY